MQFTRPQDNNWKTTTYALGGAIGLFLGLGAAYLYTRAAVENNDGKPPSRIATADAFRLSLSAIALLRQISDLAIDRARR
jgi:hypothetical protein